MSSMVANNIGDNTHPCLTTVSVFKDLLVLPLLTILALDPSYCALIKFVINGGTPFLTFNADHTVYRVKSFRKINKCEV